MIRPTRPPSGAPGNPQMGHLPPYHMTHPRLTSVGVREAVRSMTAAGSGAAGAIEAATLP